jgi:glycosyltransferase involved in cell wall biosynthesis
MATFHILSQYIWPDAAPTGLYAEHLAMRLRKEGYDVRLVGGKGSYRALVRDKPTVPMLHVDHYRGRRGNLRHVFREYTSVKRAFAHYIDNLVESHDIVIVTSAPPNTIQLAGRIKRRGAHAIYWLQDYYPELIRGIHEYPLTLRRAFSQWWDRSLLRWDRVVKIASNLAGPAENSVVIRNWPTFTFPEPSTPEPRTALYSGNLGYGHDVDLLIASCAQLRDDGYGITIRADGRGARQLPSWLRVQPLHNDPQKLKDDLVRNEVHLVAAHPKIKRAIFPSKIWNSIALGRQLVCTGFAGETATELEEAKRAPFDSHLEQWTRLLVGLVSSPEALTKRQNRVLGPATNQLQPAAIR